MPLLERLKELARSMNIPSGWWLVGLVQDGIIHKIACFLNESTARTWGRGHMDNLIRTTGYGGGFSYLVTKL